MELQKVLKVTSLVNQLSKTHMGGKHYSYEVDKYGHHKYSVDVLTDSVFYSGDCEALIKLANELQLCVFIGSVNNHPVIYMQ